LPARPGLRTFAPLEHCTVQPFAMRSSRRGKYRGCLGRAAVGAAHETDRPVLARCEYGKVRSNVFQPHILRAGNVANLAVEVGGAANIEHQHVATVIELSLQGFGGEHRGFAQSRVASRWAQQWNHVPAVAPVALEVRIDGKNAAVLHEFGEADEASVGQRHRRVRIPAHRRFDRGGIVGQSLSDLQASLDDLADQIDGSSAGLVDQEAGFRDDGFAGDKRWSQCGQLLDDPSMPLVASIEQRDERAGVGDRPRHSPKPDMCFGFLDRSAGPSMTPQTSAKASMHVAPAVAVPACSSASRTTSD